MEIPTYINEITGEMLDGPFLRSGFNYDRDQVSLETGLNCKDPSLAQQHFAEDADINVIVRRFGITGQMPQGVYAPTYGDFTGVDDFRSALEAIEAAEASFMALPGPVRATFQNDPGAFVDFCSNPQNQSQLKEWGLTRDPAAKPPSEPTAPLPQNEATHSSPS